MSAPSDDKYSESSKYAPKQLSDQPQKPAAERGYITTSEHASWVEPSEKLSSERWNDPDTVLINRIALVFIIVVAVAMSAIFREAAMARCTRAAQCRFADITSPQPV